MKWKDYSKLTPEQKEEYNFKFRDKEYHRLNISGYFSLTVIFFSVISTLIFASYIVLTDENLIQYRQQITDVLSQSKNVLSSLKYTLIILIVLDIIQITKRTYDEYKWKRKVFT